MRFLVLSNEFEIVEIACVKPCSCEVLLGELLECLFVEDVLKVFELGRSAFVARAITHRLHQLTVSANCRTVKSVSASCLATKGAETTVVVKAAKAAPIAENFMLVMGWGILMK